MKSFDEIQQAHDILRSFLQQHNPANFATQWDAHAAAASLQTLCWVLDHDELLSSNLSQMLKNMAHNGKVMQKLPSWFRERPGGDGASLTW